MSPRNPRQMEFNLDRPKEPDRNAAFGGRSFYFFDLDDNVFTLPTPIFIKHVETGEEMPVNTRDWALVAPRLGREGPYEKFTVGSGQDHGFRRFRDFDHLPVQPLIEDLQLALRQDDGGWKGPSWPFFFHAVYNQRPISIITARGHKPETVTQALQILVDEGHLTQMPNLLCVYPVSHHETRLALGDSEFDMSTAELKRHAITKSVEKAMSDYGMNDYHRFGMSDDDPTNVERIIEAMRDLKTRFPENAFFVFSTHKGAIVRHEIGLESLTCVDILTDQQLKLV